MKYTYIQRECQSSSRIKAAIIGCNERRKTKGHRFILSEQISRLIEAREVVII